jgi:16S rRNA (cytosine967-C5)-methyltransferase
LSNKKIKQSSRYLAVEILDKVEASQAFSNIVLNDVLRQNQLSPEDTRFLTELVYGVIQNKLKLDYQLDPFIRKQKKIDGWVMQLLRVSLYQITLLDKVPMHAIVNEAVNIAKIRGNRGISGFVNGVLRAIERKGVRSADDISDPINKLSIKYSYPEWIVTLLSEEVGMEETEKILDSLSDKARLSLRVNTTLKSVEAVQKQLELEGFETEKSKVSDNGLICLCGLPVHSSLFKDGIITIQDESSMLVAEALQVEAGDAVLDACAAPGGKTTHIATYLDKNKGGQVTALDLHEKKIRKIRENADRLGFADIIITNAMDARKAAETFEHESFDKILIDAPCSGLGLMRRKPDIRYQKKLSDIHALQKVQLEILTSVAPLLKKGGRLVYSTCTITRKENDDVVKAFLSEQPSFEIEPVYRKNTNIKLSDDGFLHLYPHRYHTDGFFIASLRKTQSV